MAENTKQRTLLRTKNQTESTNSLNINVIVQKETMATEKKGFENLSWPEKERVVRTLCSKINQGVAPKYWTKLNNAMREREKILSKETSLNS